MNTPQILADHPLVASWLGLFFLLVLALGVLHVFRIFGGLLGLIIEEFKHELSGIAKAYRNVWRQLTTWKADP